MKFPKIGVSGFIFNKTIFPTSILLIQREKDPYKGKWIFPGGHLQIGETIENGIKREILEEVGIQVDVLIEKPFKISEIISENHHYILISKIFLVFILIFSNNSLILDTKIIMNSIKLLINLNYVKILLIIKIQGQSCVLNKSINQIEHEKLVSQMFFMDQYYKENQFECEQNTKFSSIIQEDKVQGLDTILDWVMLNHFGQTKQK